MPQPRPPRRRVILLRADAPAKPEAGQPCNGCGLCCAVAPCPLGIWLSGRRRGRCAALGWQREAGHYRCGALADPGRWLPWLPRRLGAALVRRWISAARGCDSDLEVVA